MAMAMAVAETREEEGGGAVARGGKRGAAAEARAVPAASCATAGLESGQMGHKERAFLRWLRVHGARIEKVQWPSVDTVGGVRGAVARQDIASDEPMFEIPIELMITPAVCFACPELRHVYADNSAFFAADDDLVIALFLMHERLRGADSFYAPYLAILPDPGGVAEWTPEEQLMLQDRGLIGEARRRPNEIARMHARIRDMLATEAEQRPLAFDLEAYSEELYAWAWMIIQSRAFGRRLPWTALVPFADLLNHTNVPTKYELAQQDAAAWDSGVEEEKDEEEQHCAIEAAAAPAQVLPACDSGVVFRLYPTRGNSYRKGHEVFNSYGRRSNRFLLLEYGFCLDNNEWDTYDICVRAGADTPLLFQGRCEILRTLGLGRVKLFRITRSTLNRQLVSYLRIASLPAETVAEILAARDEELLASQDDPRPESRSTFLRLIQAAWRGPVSAAHERSVLCTLRDRLQEELRAQPTTLAADQHELRAEGLAPRHQAALQYRVGRKKVLLAQIQLVQAQLGGSEAPSTPSSP